jgi:O-acetyl-ADP-ribose deacetylase (regulator of RNase III)
MTHTILDGDMFASGAASLVCPVNTIGVMGAGLAKVFAKRYPDACRLYKRECAAGAMAPGDVLPVLSGSRERGPGKHGPLICFVGTKYHWRNPSKIEWVQACATALVIRARANASTHTSLALPAIGSGLGELSLDDVRPILVAAARRIEAAGVKVYLYGPNEKR